MARLPGIEGLEEHGSDFRRFCQEGKKYYQSHPPPSEVVKPKRKRYFRRVNPLDCFEINHGEVTICGCDLPEGVRPINARKIRTRKTPA